MRDADKGSREQGRCGRNSVRVRVPGAGGERSGRDCLLAKGFLPKHLGEILFVPSLSIYASLTKEGAIIDSIALVDTAKPEDPNAQHNNLRIFSVESGEEVMAFTNKSQENWYEPSSFYHLQISASRSSSSTLSRSSRPKSGNPPSPRPNPISSASTTPRSSSSPPLLSLPNRLLSLASRSKVSKAFGSEEVQRERVSLSLSARRTELPPT
jgi:hypothetical protein